MIELDQVSVTFDGAATPALRDVSVAVDEGELALVIGRTGSGKSTLLGTMTGQVPHFTGGTLAGHVRIHRRDTRTHRPRDLADLVGVVGQDPLAGFVTDTVEEELAYGMEQLGLPASTMRKRVEETLDVLGIADLRGAALRELSGGQQQRVAIARALASRPSIIFADEPTGNLDSRSSREVLTLLRTAAREYGQTIAMVSHDPVAASYADRILVIADGRLVGDHGALTPQQISELLIGFEVGVA